MKFYKHQQKIIDAKPDRLLLAHDTGAGKSRTSLELAMLKLEPTLIICPKALKKNWARELTKIDFCLPSLIVSKEEFRRDWDVLANFPTVICDEAHYFAGQKSQMSKSLMKYFKKWNTPYRFLLSATPYMSTPWNIYVLAKLLGRDYGWKWWDSTFFIKIKMGNLFIPKVKSGIEDQLAGIIQEIGDTVKLEDCFDVPKQLTTAETLALTAPQLKGIKDITEPEHIVYWTKKHQIENGVLKGDEYNDHAFFKNDKTDRIKDLCFEHKKVAVICRYNLQIDHYQEELEKAGHKVWIIRGDVVDRDSVVQEVNSSEEGIVLIQAACSEGYELPSVGYIIFASLDFSYKNYKQMKGRFLRANALKRNVFIHLVVDDGVDGTVYKNIMMKKDFSFKIYNGPKGTKL